MSARPVKEVEARRPGPKEEAEWREQCRREHAAALEVVRQKGSWFQSEAFAQKVMQCLDSATVLQLRGRVSQRWRAVYWSLVLKDSFSKEEECARDDPWMFRWCLDQYLCQWPRFPSEGNWIYPVSMKRGWIVDVDEVLESPGRVTGRLLADGAGLRVLCETCGSELVETDPVLAADGRGNSWAPYDRFRCPQLFCYWLHREALARRMCLCMFEVDASHSIKRVDVPWTCHRKHLPALLVDIVLRRSLAQKYGVEIASRPASELQREGYLHFSGPC